MKQLFLAVSILIGADCIAQIGIITLDKRAEELPVGQWYTYSTKDFRNNVLFYQEEIVVMEKIDEILRDHSVFFEEFKLDEFGDKFWVLEKENGFTSTLYLIPGADGWSYINVYTEF
jgi:hypothetical protein